MTQRCLFDSTEVGLDQARSTCSSQFYVSCRMTFEMTKNSYNRQSRERECRINFWKFTSC